MAFRTVAFMLIPLTLAFSSPVLAAQEGKTSQRLMLITGKGEVKAAPDIAIISLGVTSQAKTAQDALSQNTKNMSGLLDSLKADGIAEKDLQTSNFSVQPIYSRVKNTGNQQPQIPRILAYRVSNQLTAVIRDLDKLGAILDKSMSAGSNQFNSLQFSIDKPAPLRDDARKLAVADAKRKAEIYAQAAGVALGNVNSISEAGGHRPPQPLGRHSVKMMAAEAAPVPIAQGEQSVSVSVNIVWEIR
ncbi:MAG: SIMPL domain-containing protein [Hyphomicrobiales bacterium]